MATALNKKACEKKIMLLLKEVVKIYKKYNPDGEYLDMCFLDDSIMLSNRYYGEDSNKPLHIYQTIKESEETMTEGGRWSY